MARSRSVVAGVMRSTMPFGKATLSLDPVGQLRIDQRWPGRRPPSAVTWPLWGMLSQDMTVNGDDAVGAAPHQPGQDQAEHGLRRWRCLPASATMSGCVGLNTPRGRVDEVAALGDGQRDDADRRIGQPFDDGSGIAGHQEVDHDAGDARAHVAAVLLDHGGQPVLLLELVAADLLAVEHAGPDDRPVMVVAGVEQIVEIDRLMRAMEIADAEMHDAAVQRRCGRNAARRPWRAGCRALPAESLTVMDSRSPLAQPRFPSQRGRRRPGRQPSVDAVGVAAGQPHAATSPSRQRRSGAAWPGPGVR